MSEKIVDFPIPTPSPTSQTLGMGSIGQNSTFSRTASTQTNKHICTGTTCSDPENFCQGVGKESRLLNLFYSLQRGSNGFITHFPGGSNFFQGGGVQMLISIETHITINCDFPGGSGPPIPPLDLHMDNVVFWHE